MSAAAANAKAAKFVVWSVNKSLDDNKKYNNVKIKVMGSVRNNTADITEYNQEDMCNNWMKYADTLVTADDAARCCCCCSSSIR